MKLTYNGLLNKAYWQERGYQLPLYDIPRVRAATLTAPRWLHLGAGNIFRAFLANLQQRLLDQRDAETGIIAAEGYDDEIIQKAYRPYDNLSIYVRLKGDRSLDKIILASIIESLTMQDDLDRLRDIAANPSLQMVSLTITEKGYHIKDGTATTTRPSRMTSPTLPPARKATSGTSSPCSTPAGKKAPPRWHWSAWTTCRITAKNCAPPCSNLRTAGSRPGTSRPNLSPGWKAAKSATPGP